MATYTINLIKPDGSVDVTFSVDGKKQNLSGKSVGDKEMLASELNDYALAYEAGLATKTVVVDPAAKALEGKAQTVEAVVAEEVII